MRTTVSLNGRKRHSCVGCGASLRYPFERTGRATAATGKSSELAAKALLAAIESEDG